MINVKFKGFFLTVFIIFFVSNIAAGNNLLKGKDFVKLGTLQTISGKLFEEDAEWYLETDEGTMDLHFGPREFMESKNVSLKGKEDFTITGFLYENNLAVVYFVFNDKLIELRTEDGEPLWKDTKFSKQKGTGNKKEEKKNLKKEVKKGTKKVYTVNANKCIGCKLCVASCPVKAIGMVDGKAVIDADKCIDCGICENGDGKNYNGCPVKAISKN